MHTRNPDMNVNYESLPSIATIINITGTCISPLTAMISPKSVPNALTIKLLTVKVKPEVKAKRQPKANVNFAFLRTRCSSSSESKLSSTEKRQWTKYLK